MRLNLSKALLLALVVGVLPACDRVATDREEAASKGATGQASGGSTNERNAPARPASK
jgi:hypothetical protein